MTIESDDLSERLENQRELRVTVPIRQFQLEHIIRHFDENLDEIVSLGTVADAVCGKRKSDAEAIWRAQLLLLESSLDFYLHELCKYGMLKMFDGSWNRTDSFCNLKVPMTKVVAALNHPESSDWMLEYSNDKVSHEIYMAPDDIKSQCSLLGINFENVCRQVDATCKEGLKALYKRRNQIAHQTDRRHEDAQLENISRQSVAEAIKLITSFVRKLHSEAEGLGSGQ